jgi:hypothetical protein
MKKLFGHVAVIGAFISFSFPVYAHEAHVHGVAQMNLAIEGPGGEIEVDSPLGNFISFEHKPETDAQKQEVRDMAVIMREADKLFVLTPAAGCQLQEVSLESDALSADLLSPAGVRQVAAQRETGDEQAGDGHADLEAKMAFMCRNPEKLNSLTVDMFRAFPNLHEIEVQLVTPTGQKAAELTPESSTIRW